MVKIIDDGKVKDLYDFPNEFIKTVAKVDNELENHCFSLDEIIITLNNDGRKDCEFVWSCDLRLMGL